MGHKPRKWPLRRDKGKVLRVTHEKEVSIARNPASQDSGRLHDHNLPGDCTTEAHHRCARSEAPSGDPVFMEGQSRPKVLFQRPLVFWVRLLVGVIFIAASIDKILHPVAFARMVTNYQVLPDAFINVTTIALPCVELVLGSLLVLGLWIPGAVVLANLLFLAFFGSLLFNLARGLDIHCGCFTTSTQRNPLAEWYVIRDALFLLLGGYLFYGVFLKRGRENEGQQERPFIGNQESSKEER
jgi:uncharacterized membrane protein YphA (DoxX/SURF4 family)